MLQTPIHFIQVLVLNVNIKTMLREMLKASFEETLGLQRPTQDSSKKKKILLLG